MNRQVKVEAAAAGEIEAAFDWYENRHSGLGAEFLRSVAQASNLLERDAIRFPITREPFRWMKLRKFPYAMHFRIKADCVSIVACLHFRQSPERWPGV